MHYVRTEEKAVGATARLAQSPGLPYAALRCPALRCPALPIVSLPRIDQPDQASRSGSQEYGVSDLIFERIYPWPSRSS